MLKDIWESIDKTPYVLFTGKNALGIFVINNENEPVIEHMYFEDACEESEKIAKEVEERFYRLNREM